MRTGKGSQEDEEYEEEEFGSRTRGLSFNQTMVVNANSNNNSTNKGVWKQMGKAVIRLQLYDQNTLSRSRGGGVRHERFQML